MDTLYTDILLDVYRHPLNKVALSNFDVHIKETNPLCGDEIELFIKFGSNDTVEAIGWTGEGCAISQASASLLTDHLKNMQKQEIKNIRSNDVLDLLKLKNLNPTRTRCALLALEALKKANDKIL